MATAGEIAQRSFDDNVDAQSSTMKTALSSSYDAVVSVPDGYLPFPLTASGQVSAVPGRVAGIWVASGTTVTVKLWNNTSAATNVVIDTTSVTAGQYYPLPNVQCTIALYATLSGTSPNVTVFFKPDWAA